MSHSNAPHALKCVFEKCALHLKNKQVVFINHTHGLLFKHVRCDILAAVYGRLQKFIFFSTPSH